MRKEKIIVRDNKKIFLKMFKRKFKENFEFYGSSLLEKGNESEEFDRYIFVIYNRQELTDFLKLEIKSANIMVCLYDKQLHDSLSYFAEIKKIVLTDASKTKMELHKDLDVYFNNASNLVAPKQETSLFYQKIQQMQFEKFHDALFL